MADSYEYLQQAFNIKNYFSFYCLDFSKPINIDFYSKRPPLYGMTIMGLKAIYNSDYIILFVQNILSVLNIYGLIKILKEYKFSFRVRIIVIVFLVLFPSQFIYTNMVMAEILVQTFMFWTFYCIFYYVKKGGNKYILYYNILISLAVLTKPVLVYFWIPNLILMLFFFIKEKKFVILLMGCIQPFVIFLLSLYTYNTTGSFQYSSIKQMNYLNYNAGFLLVKVYGEEGGWKKWKEYHNYLDTISDYSLRSRETERIATEIILDNKFEYAKFHLKGMLNYFIDPGRFDVNNFLGIKEDNNSGLLFAFTKEGYSGILKFMSNQSPYMIIYLVIILIVNFLMLISLFVFPFIKKISPVIRLFVVFVIFYMCFFSGILGTVRYKIHIYPLILFTIPFTFELVKGIFLRKKSI